MLKDSQERLQATDPGQSFIVQAPAGSGKTELLTQRYLRLLSTVSAPEQIVALTFTRKAASEMRERVLHALARAQKGLPASSPHQQLTNAYAIEALKRSRSLDWQLLKNPVRLKIVTIDSLCQSISQAIPLYEQQTPFAGISNSPRTLYQKAVRACLSDVLNQDVWHPSIQLLLEHLDNRQDKLIKLLCDLLATREQWLAPIYSARYQTKEAFEDALDCIEQHELQRLIEAIPDYCRDELCTLVSAVAQIEADTSSPRFSLCDWTDVFQLDRNLASGLAAILLTKDDKFRKSFDHHVGLKRGACANSLYDDLKARSKELLNELQQHPDFLQVLLRVKSLPPPIYDASQWNVLQALLTLLPLLAAHLQLMFQQANDVDFTAISHQALLALGDDDSPTDLALYFDNAIHHLLVDEFQDTSIQQFELLTKLVQGWLPDEGKTLFLVGDPMQSIYRFRQAEVGLFLKAKRQGIAAIALTPLELCCNFRSTNTLVNWVNTQFTSIFPINDDMESGAVSFHPSVTNANHSDNSGIFAKQFNDKNQEARALIEQVTAELKNHPTDNIAILVRSRNQLSKIVPLLRAADIPFQGVDIEKLSSLPHLLDIWSITKALLLPADRLSWLSLLRSPWCGINLTDLHHIANFDKQKSIYFALSKLQKISSLSHEGLIRAQFIYTVMNSALASRHQQSLADWVLDIIRQMHCAHILDAMQQSDLEQFFMLLTRCEQDGQLADFELFEDEFAKLYSERVTQSRLQIMTIHKSKGLEFDCVILPGLGSKAQQREKPLLRWLKLPAEHNELLLLSPVHAAGQTKCPLYDYLGDIASEKERYEQQRLLYVAVTRAKKRLVLLDSHEKISQGSFRDLLSTQVFDIEQTQDNDAISAESKLPILSRLPQRFYEHLPIPQIENINTSLPLPTNNNTRMAGVIAHELLQWICDQHPEQTSELPWGMIANQCKRSGFTSEEQQDVLQLLKNQIEVMFADPIGQWLMKQHAEEHNEYELLVHHKGKTVTRIIDRTFLANNCRWIIDFKTGKDDAKTRKNHQEQVNEYAKILSTRHSLPIKCGLYYLANNRWVAWDYEPGELLNNAAALLHR